MKYSLGIKNNNKFVEIITDTLEEIDKITCKYPNRECLAVGLYLHGHIVSIDDNLAIKSSSDFFPDIMYSEYPLNNLVGDQRLFNVLIKTIKLLGSIYKNYVSYDSDTGKHSEIPTKESKKILERIVGENNISFFDNVDFIEFFRNQFYDTHIFASKDSAKYLDAVNHYYYKLKGTLNSTIDTYGLEDRYYQAVCEGFFRMFYKNTQANYSYSRLRNFYIKLYNKFVVKRIPEERIEEYNDK